MTVKKRLLVLIIIIFCTMNLSGQNEPLTITPGGNVGINTTSPQEPLDMTGDLLVEGTLYSDTFAPEVYSFPLGGGADSHTLPDATQVRHEVILLWKNGNQTTRVLTINTQEGQTIDGLTADTWKGEGTGKMRLLPYNGNWMVLSYISQRTEIENDANGDAIQVRHWMKLADGTLIQWGARKLTQDIDQFYSPIHINFRRDFIDDPVVTTSTHGSDTYTSIGEDNTNPTTAEFDIHVQMYYEIIFGYFYKLSRDPHYGYWRAYGRWY
jgi:hypothetical protein